MPPHLRIRLARALLGLGVLAQLRTKTALAQTEHPTPAFTQMATVGYLYGFNWRGDRPRRDVVQVDYANGWRFGDNYFYLEVPNLLTHRSAGDDPGAGRTAPYGEWHSRLHLTDLLGAHPPWAMDAVSLATQVDFADGAVLLLGGLGIDWSGVLGQRLTTNFYWRKDLDRPGATWEVVVAGGWPIELGSVRLSYGGYAKFVGPEAGLVPFVVSGTQLLWEPGRLAKSLPRGLRLGIDFKLWRNEGGVRGVHELVPQVIAKWVFQ